MKFNLDPIASAVTALNEEQSGILIKKVCSYVQGTEYDKSDITVDAFFNLIKIQLDEEIKHAAAVSEKRKRSGKIGGKTKAENLALANATKCYQMLEQEENLANASKCKQMLGNASNCYQMLDNENKEKDFQSQNAENQADKTDDGSLANASKCYNAAADDIYIYNNNDNKDIDNDNISDNILVLDNNMSSSPKIDLRKLLAFFNSIMAGKGIPQIKSISNKRKAAVLARFRQYGKQAIMDAIIKASESDFLNGATEQAFVASFDWIFKPNNFAKVLEGNYSNRTASVFTEQPTSGAAKTIHSLVKLAENGQCDSTNGKGLGDDGCTAIIDSW